MKSVFVLLFLVAFAVAYEEKRLFGEDQCQQDEDCPGQCCRGYFTKKCKDYIAEGERCYHSALGCGCEPGTSCKFVPKGGVSIFPAFLCVRDEEGSGDM